MKLEEVYNLAKTLAEERGGGENDGFKVQLGENEGENIPHFHLFNNEIGKKKKKTAIRLDMPYYFLHGDKTYILNSKERKNLIAWLDAKPDSSKINKNNETGEFPKNNWENLRNMWNNYYPQAKITCNKIDYSTLCKDYKQR
jgi:hypothetical protein